MVENQEHVAEDSSFGSQLNGLLRGGRSYWLVNLVNFTDGIAYFGILNLLVLYLTQNLDLPSHLAHPTISIYAGSVTLFMLMAGSWVDRWGTRNSITISLVLALIGRLGLWGAAAAPGHKVEVAIPFLFCMGMATGILQPALYAGVKAFTHQRVAAMGFSLLYAIMNLGIVAESFVSPYLRTSEGLNLGIRGVFLAMALVTGIQLVAHVLLFPREQPDEPKMLGEAAHLEAAAPASGPHPLKDVRFLFFIFMLLPVRTLFAHQWMTIPEYVFRCFDQSMKDRYEWVTALNPLVIVIGVPVLTYLTRRVPVLRMMIIGTLVSASATFLLSLPPEPGRLIAYVILFSVGEALWSSRFLEHVATIAPPNRVGAYMGFANLPWFIAKTTTGFYSGLMLEKYIPKGGAQHPEMLWTIYGIIALTSPLGLILASSWLNSARSATSPEESR